MKVTDLLVHCLENEEVEFIFGMIGSETLDLADSLSKSSQIQFVPVRHEQGAAFMADVYGRLSEKAGVCLATLGPGAANLLTGVASAQLDHSPVVALIGQAGTERHHKESHQYLDIVRLFEPATKSSIEIKEAVNVPAIIRKAFRLAKMEKPGSVAIVLPENVAGQTVTAMPLSVPPLPESVPDAVALMAAKTLIENHRKPFILVGNGVIRQAAAPELETFVNRLQAPVTHSFMAKGVLEKKHPSNFYTFGFSEKDEILRGITECDLLIVIGFDFVEKLPVAWNKRKLPILHIDTLPAEINEYYPVAVELVGNIKKTLQLLIQEAIPSKPWVPSGNLHDHIRTVYQINPKQQDSSTMPFTIENMLHRIENLVPENTIIISDVGAHKVSIARSFQPKKPNRLVLSNGLASMGIAIPGAIGAKLACPGDPVICLTGDGGALMNFAEIETAKRLGLSYIIIVLNDSMLKLEVQQMDKKFGNHYGVTFGNPDFVQLAESFGVRGFRVRTLVEFEAILRDSLKTCEDIVIIDAVF